MVRGLVVELVVMIEKIKIKKVGIKNNRHDNYIIIIAVYHDSNNNNNKIFIFLF